MSDWRQGTPLKAVRTFGFKVNGKGRTIVFKEGQRFWVTNTVMDQMKSDRIMIDRQGRGHISHGYAFTRAQTAEYFDVM